MARIFNGSITDLRLSNSPKLPDGPMTVSLWLRRADIPADENGWNTVTFSLPSQKVRSAYLDGYGGPVRWWWLWRLKRRYHILMDRLMKRDRRY